MKLDLLIIILSERFLRVLTSFSCYYQGWNRGNDSMVVVECSPWAYGCITEHISKDLIFQNKVENNFQSLDHETRLNSVY